MSFTGAIGTIMVGSGFKELFGAIYCGNNVEKIIMVMHILGRFEHISLRMLLWRFSFRTIRLIRRRTVCIGKRNE